jgi:4,5-DOPA dioxygenase extradiol
MASLHTLQNLHDGLPSRAVRTPLLFIGHGSPMNGIEENDFSQYWENLGRSLDPPAAVLCISAHWFTSGSKVTAMEKPPTIHDFYGFPQALFDVEYPAPGNPALAKDITGIIHGTGVQLDHEWGLDHGTWSVVRKMFPEANVPVVQLSIDNTQGPAHHYGLARDLSSLRKRGVLIIGSGNMVHNLGIMNWKLPDAGYEWALEMNETFKSKIATRDHDLLIHYQKLGAGARLAIPTPEHYLPLLYVLGLQEQDESVSFFNDKTVMGSVSMTSVSIG